MGKEFRGTGFLSAHGEEEEPFVFKLHGREKDRSWKMKGLGVVGNLTVRCWGILMGLDFDVIWANNKNKNTVEMVHNKENNNFTKQKWILWKNLSSIKGIHVEI